MINKPGVPYRDIGKEKDIESFDLDGGAPTKGGFLRKGIIFISAFIVLYSLSDYVYRYRRAKIEPVTLIDAINKKSDGMTVWGGPAADQVLENPHISWFDSIFCIGYRKATSCSNKPLHPMYKYFVEESLKIVPPEQLYKEYGISPKETRVPGKTTEQVHARPQLLNR